MKPCSVCGTPFSPRTRTQVLCGERECRLGHMRRTMAERDRKHRAEHGVSYFERYKAEKVCSGCGETFRTKPSHNSQQCGGCQRREVWRLAGAKASARANRARGEARKLARSQLVLAGPLRRGETLGYRQAVVRLEKAAEGSRPKNAIWVAGTCIRDGTPFVCLWTGTPPLWCSRSCARADAKQARRVRERGGHIRYSRHAIFERDRWTCQLCGKRVKRSAKVPDPKAAVIDHIVPLAAGIENGGVDAPWNVQCAHFLCNSIKSGNYAAPALF